MLVQIAARHDKHSSLDSSYPQRDCKFIHAAMGGGNIPSLPLNRDVRAFRCGSYKIEPAKFRSNRLLIDLAAWVQAQLRWFSLGSEIDITFRMPTFCLNHAIQKLCPEVIVDGPPVRGRGYVALIEDDNGSEPLHRGSLGMPLVSAATSHPNAAEIWHSIVNVRFRCPRSTPPMYERSISAFAARSSCVNPRALRRSRILLPSFSRAAASMRQECHF